MLLLCLASSHEHGMGHLFRALVLARALAARGRSCRFALNDHPPAVERVAGAGFAFDLVDPDDEASAWETRLIRAHSVRLWIDDRRETSAGHAARVKRAGASRVTFDDAGLGAALADLEVDALGFKAPGQAAARRVLRGLEYLVLDPEVARHKRIRKSVRSLVVTMGGSDTHGLTLDVVRLLKQRERRATVILGPGFRHFRELEAELASGFEVKAPVRDMPAELARHDLAITAGGITCFEAAAAGLPALIIPAEPWEKIAATRLAGAGAARILGYRHDIDGKVLDQDLPLPAMSAAGLASVPADGADRVAREILAL